MTATYSKEEPHKVTAFKKIDPDELCLAFGMESNSPYIPVNIGKIDILL